MRQPFTKSAVRAATGVIAAFVAAPVFAHSGAHHAFGSFASGFMHPLSGWDHLLAMLAVGVWAAQQRPALKWTLPLLFPLVMVIGALSANAGLPASLVEAGIALSVLVLGLFVVFSVRMSVWSASTIVSLFAMVHGYAHGAEAEAGDVIGLYGAGFFVATLFLHLAGLFAARLARRAIAVSPA